MLSINSKAPNFTLPDINGRPFDLRQFTDRKNIVLVFYPFDWSPVCGDQISLYNEMLSLFDKQNAVVIGISTDSFYSHSAFSECRKLRFPLLSDFEPKGKVARLYGAYNEKEGHCNRSLFVIDQNSTIVWSYQAPDSENPGADGILNALQILNSQTLK